MAAKILIVDDEVGVLDMTRYLFEKKGYQVAVAQNGEGALAAVEREGFDAMLLDIKMPGMDGLEVLRRVKRLRPEMPVVIMSVYYDQNQEIQSAVDSEADGCIRKPFNVEEALTVVEKVLQQKRK